MYSMKKGFTLIEILIVIAIIAVLTGIITVSLAPARKKGRDAQRVSDLANMRIAIALYKSVNGHYPIHDDIPGTWATENIGSDKNNEAWEDLRADLAPYMALPRDPLSSGFARPSYTGGYHYAYKSDDNGTKYDLIAQFEDTKNPNRCEVKNWKYHTSGESSWCPPWNPSSPYSRYLYADH